MRSVKYYRPRDSQGLLMEFMEMLNEKLRYKLMKQLMRLYEIPLCDFKEPHFKHFGLEKYSRLYELREKNKVLVRIIFTIQDGDIILLAPFIKRQTRDTMRALEQSLRMLAELRDHPEYAVELKNIKEEQTA